MEELLRAILSELTNGKRAMLATIVARRGSAPRGVGTAMVVSESDEQTGTVGGGSMEYRVRQDALKLLQENACARKDYEIHADEKDAYSGGVSILFRLFAGEHGTALTQRMLDAILRGEHAYLVCTLAQGNAPDSNVVDAPTLCSLAGLEDPPEQTVVTDGDSSLLIEPLLDAPRVILFGGGHVAQVMARQLSLLDYRVWVVEDRAEFATEALFPSAERVIHCDYDCAEAILQLSKCDHVIVMSRGHETDYQILRWVLRSGADYIGCIGSKRKIALTRERLLNDGLTSEQIDRLHAPIGLAIGAETPAEIAVSVAAELIQYLAKKQSLNK